MRSATLTRLEDSAEGSFWKYVSDSGKFECPVLGLNWRGNAVGESHVPPGTYRCKRYPSPAHGGASLYHLEGVPGRTVVEIHSANLAGDPAQGYVRQVRGCFAPGKEVGVFKKGETVGGFKLEKDQRGVTRSAAALALLEIDMEDKDFDLTVVVPGLVWPVS